MQKQKFWELTSSSKRVENALPLPLVAKRVRVGGLARAESSRNLVTRNPLNLQFLHNFNEGYGKVGGASSMGDVRLHPNRNTVNLQQPSSLSHPHVQEFSTNPIRACSSQVSLPKSKSLLVKKTFVSAYDVRPGTKIRNENTVIGYEQKIINFLRNYHHNHIRIHLLRSKTKFKLGNLTADEFFQIVQFVYGHIEPRFFKEGQGRLDIIKLILQLSKDCHPAITVPLKKDYLLNPMAPHAKPTVFKFLAQLCDYVSARLI